MRARVVVTVAAIAGVVGLGLLARGWFAPEESPGQSASETFAGQYAAGTELGVRNLTIQGGHVRVSYELDVLFEHPDDRATLRCGLVDTSGTLDFFEGSRQDAPEGAWTHLEFSSAYELPGLTLGIRCSPSADGVMSAVFRDVSLAFEPID